MGKLLILLLQKFLPAARKSFWVQIRKKAGGWTDLLVPASDGDFKFKGQVYYLKGRPDIDESTNQRRYSFLEGIPYPVNFDSEHDKLLKINSESGNVALQLTEADEQGFQRAMMLKGAGKFDPIMIILLLCAGIALLVLFNIYLTWEINSVANQAIEAAQGAGVI